MKQRKEIQTTLSDFASLVAGFILILHAFATATGVMMREVLQKLAQMPSMLWTEAGRDPATARVILLCGMILVAGALGGIGLLIEQYQNKNEALPIKKAI